MEGGQVLQWDFFTLETEHHLTAVIVLRCSRLNRAVRFNRRTLCKIAGRVRGGEGRGRVRADGEELRRGRAALQVPPRRVLRAVVRPLQGARAGVRQGLADAHRGRRAQKLQ